MKEHKVKLQSEKGAVRETESSWWTTVTTSVIGIATAGYQIFKYFKNTGALTKAATDAADAVPPQDRPTAADAAEGNDADAAGGGGDNGGLPRSDSSGCNGGSGGVSPGVSPTARLEAIGAGAPYLPSLFDGVGGDGGVLRLGGGASAAASACTSDGGRAPATANAGGRTGNVYTLDGKKVVVLGGQKAVKGFLDTFGEQLFGNQQEAGGGAPVAAAASADQEGGGAAPEATQEEKGDVETEGPFPLPLQPLQPTPDALDSELAGKAGEHADA